MKYLIACPGPSLNQEEVDYGIKNVDEVITCNGSYSFSTSGIFYSSDPAFFREYMEELNSCNFTSMLCPFDTGIETVQRVTSSQERIRGDRQDSSLYLGHSTGYAAIDLAILSGASEIYLLGYDMQKKNNKAHFFGDYKPSLHKESPYERFISDFEGFNCRGTTIINCTLDSALDVFEKKSIYKAL